MSEAMASLKDRMRATWSAGDFGQIARSYTAGAEDFVNGLGLRPGMKVLDVACGTGNSALPAARLGAIVTGIDIAANLIEQARANAEREGLSAEFAVGDAEDIQFADASFDAVITMFGAMFAPRPDVVAAELLRVCKPGGFIAMANWTPEGFVGQMVETVSGYAPQPPGMALSVLWGDEATVRERFRHGVTDLQTERRKLSFNFPVPPAEVVEHFRRYFGPLQMAFDSLDEDRQAAFRRDLLELWTAANRAGDGTTAYEAEYLKVVATRVANEPACDG
jgi:SAM-dependent methyltransferase